MKHVRLFLLALLALTVVPLAARPAPAGAQVKIGISGGLNLASLKVDFSDADAVVDVHWARRADVGVFAAIPLGGPVALQLGGNYALKGAITKFSVDGVPAEWTHKVNYVEGSALVRYGWQLGGGFSTHLLLGPTFARELSCDVTVAARTSRDSSLSGDSTCEDAGFTPNTYDVGIAGGGGLEFLSSGGIGVTAHAVYTYGLIDADQGSDSEIWHRTVKVTAGLVFAIG